ncbi:conjugal transfer protein [Virgisporangium aurantiacum]|uniref:Conjugative transposon protein TcpC n=1 Tax=Virgisporangium aurantiacum TaxID=175570 RepID=A0A8J3Z9V6_9ACTN|nr:conjugal transfer protein [Virgisporangium aurantiacum]GIJ60061.1 hypothetical protein Vau01_075770 [Virgisporangium aurantiacum]
MTQNDVHRPDPAGTYHQPWAHATPPGNGTTVQPAQQPSHFPPQVAVAVRHGVLGVHPQPAAPAYPQPAPATYPRPAAPAYPQPAAPAYPQPAAPAYAQPGPPPAAPAYAQPGPPAPAYAQPAPASPAPVPSLPSAPPVNSEPNRPAEPTRRKRFGRNRKKPGGIGPAAAAAQTHTPSLENRLDVAGDEATDPDPGFVIENGTVEPLDGGPRKVRLRSRFAGGRWRRHVLLLMMMFALLVVVVNGVYRLAGKALYDPPRPEPGDAFPVAQASGYAARFVYAYLTWDQADPRQRAEQLSVFFPQRTDNQHGWDGHGKQRVVGQPLPAGVTTRDDHRAVVHLAALVEPGGWTCMDVAVSAADGGRALAITSYAAFTACPPVAAASAPAENRPADDAAAAEMRPTIVSFFRAYGVSSPDLAQLVTPDSGITGLRGAGVFVDVTRVFVPLRGDGDASDERVAEVVMRWRTASGGAVIQTYRLALRSIGGRWFVHSIHGGVESAEIAPAVGGVAPPPSEPTASPTRPGGQPEPVVSGSGPLPGSRTPPPSGT